MSDPTGASTTADPEVAPPAPDRPVSAGGLTKNGDLPPGATIGGLSGKTPPQPLIFGRRASDSGGGIIGQLKREPFLTPGRLLTLIAVLLGAYAALTIVVALRTILVMFLVALFLSFAMEPAVQWLSLRGLRRGLATSLVFLGVFLVGIGLIAAIVPLVIAQVTDLVNNIPQSLDELEALLPNLPFVGDLSANQELREQFSNFSGDIGNEIRSFALGAASNVANIGATALGVLFQLLSVALVTFYLVADGPRARRVLARGMAPDRQREMLAIWELAVKKTGGYIYSRLLLAAACAVTSSLFLLLLGVPYPIPLGLFVGTTSAFIPVVGTYLGGVLLMLVALVDDPWKALWVAVYLILYQQLENYLIAPRLQARTMDIHPAVAFVSVLVGGTLLGAVGALLALPATAILQAVMSTFVRRQELIAELAEFPLPPETKVVRREVPPSLRPRLPSLPRHLRERQRQPRARV